MSQQASQTPVYTPDAEVQGLLDAWYAVKTRQAQIDDEEREAWEALNEHLDARLGPGAGAVFVTVLGDIDPAKAGRSFPVRGESVDYYRIAELVRERLGESAFRRYFATERVTVYHANREAIAAAIASQDEALAAIVDECHTPGEPVLTRVPPAKASKDLARQAEPMPSRRGRRAA